MHEASLIRNLMHRIEEIAETEGAKRVVSVSVWLGALSHMSERHFIEHFNDAAKGTIAEDAELAITLSTDTDHKDAQELLLDSIEVEV
ncbi:hydrogenase maturation nickel metallochaperone HypA [Modicisalibacter xianhensis]|uniref:Hydrogenase nickel incorporation protein HypA/HybF n=1 Tax=Modicisalibacter xianhensis TaxID=442341 RepID=A0A1I2ZYW3_9GAMM|nr:hydrogenase maturation nickel metallochaperone HypA [Halomonas xianhensis]SFH42846.1 hydrogenase nickel incorporation protein HypA/HybF [Halomonas xianhensis]